jgi:hypothetical protein
LSRFAFDIETIHLDFYIFGFEELGTRLSTLLLSLNFLIKGLRLLFLTIFFVFRMLLADFDLKACP